MCPKATAVGSSKATAVGSSRGPRDQAVEGAVVPPQASSIPEPLRAGDTVQDAKEVAGIAGHAAGRGDPGQDLCLCFMIMIMFMIYIIFDTS